MQGTLQLFRTQQQLDASAKDVKALAVDGIPYEVLDRVGYGPCSQAIKVGDLLFVSGQLPMDPAIREFNSADAVAHPNRAPKPCCGRKGCGSDPSKTVKATVLPADLGDFAGVDRIYAGFFTAPYHARACYEVKALSKGAKVEIEAVIAF